MRLVYVPTSENIERLRANDRRNKWLPCLLDCLSSRDDTSEAAYMLMVHLCKTFPEEFESVAKFEAVLAVVTRMSPAQTFAMMSDANLNYSQIPNCGTPYGCSLWHAALCAREEV